MSRDGTDPVSREPPEPDGSELLGTVIADRYALECVLGRGGMGLVYRASHLGLRRQVAVKILHPALAASSDVRNRFDREAFAAGKIDHPNCINVMDSGKLPDGSRYLAMELLDGKSLADVLEQEGQIAPGRALHILAHILRGLGHIHSAGLIHRDIKPENIFLIRQGQDEDFAKILDFGIAKGIGKTDLEEGVKLTQAGMAFGTPIYMAPEQALGNPMDGRADLYAAAVLGYEMLCGQPPFYSDDKLEVMSMHTAKPVPPMRQRLIKGAKPVPSSLERLMLRGLTKKPADRFANAEVFLAAVEAALETPDGGVTDVSFERPERLNQSTTGSQPLVSPDGEVAIASGEAIADAIEDALNTPLPPMPVVAPPVLPPRRPTPAPLRTRPAPAPPRGGVGIGLPYTGPSGEPIFGLTPEQRLAQVNLQDLSQIANALEPGASMIGVVSSSPRPSRKKWFVYGGIVAVAIIVGMVVAIVTTRRSDDGEEKGIDRDGPAGQAYAEYKRGNLGDAMKILKEKPDVLASNGEMLLVLGHIHAAQFQTADALTAYAKAITLRVDLLDDEDLRANLKIAAANPDPQIVAASFDLWMRTGDPEARRLLVNAAESDKMKRRRAVRPVVERFKLDKDVDWPIVYTYDLQDEQDCELRRQAVGRLRALGDPRAIPAIERAKWVSNPRYPRKNINACLVEEAKAAIGYLHTQKKPAGGSGVP